MKKGLKVLLGILIPIIIILVVYIVLIIKQIVPNPFLDTSDLVCTREGEIEETIDGEKFQETKKIIFKFDKWGRIFNGEEETQYIYENIESAQNKFKQLQILFNNYSNETLKLKDNIIIIKSSFPKEEFNFEKDSRVKIIEKYKEYSYECE